ncbi:MAG: peptidyl-prolyl cis-trans isomerase [Bacteriovoracaceae bacterium]|nr:peptidyl-prolyl cis-trans isomerase [Bacteriovoracaceae bacterium]
MNKNVKLWYLILVLSVMPSFSSAKLLDKIVAIVDDNIFTLSQIKRVQTNLIARNNISPIIYAKTDYTEDQIAEIMIRKIIIRHKLSEQGILIGDDQVKMQIKQTKTNLNITHDALMDFLQMNNITYEEYFELSRESIEFSYFNHRVISPLITISEQDIKNAFYKENESNNTLAFKYTLVDFSLDKDQFKPGMVKEFKKILKEFQVTGNLPERFKDVATNVLGDIAEDGLFEDLRVALKKTDEGSFTDPILLAGQYHVFFVKKKDLVESDLYLDVKPKIKNQLYKEVTKQITDLWFQREKNKHYIKKFI